jgi:signal transduction histidine kinase
MRIRVILILSTLVLLPVMGMGWLGLRLVLNESKMAKHQLRELLDTQLTAWDEQLHELMQDRERVFLALAAESDLGPEGMRAAVAKEDAIVQAFLMNAQGRLDYPVREQATPAECAFLDRTAHVWDNDELVFQPELVQVQAKAPPAARKGALRQYQTRSFGNYNVYQVENPEDNGSQSAVSWSANDALTQQEATQQPRSQVSYQILQTNELENQSVALEQAVVPQLDSNWSGRALDPEGETASGWYTWYLGTGMQVIFWRRLADGRLLGFELDRERLLADVTAALEPDEVDYAGYGSMPSRATERMVPRVALIDGRGKTLQQWGRDGESIESLTLWTQRVLQPPLQSWRLVAYLPPHAGSTLQYGVLLNVAALLLVFAVVVLGLGAWLYQETGREMRLASQRVSFVNNVSHELKTPLTNIRMYAELLEGTVDQEDARSRKYLGTVVRESQRLSRLIGNVLTFARNQRGGRPLQGQSVVPDEVLRAILDQYRPSLESAGIEGTFVGGGGKAMRLDRDVLEQVVVNLLSNVEKYAASGKRVELLSSQDGGSLKVCVRDWGPGISVAESERIFQAFYRVSNKVNDGVAGTGIGLSIARELARTHGGDLTVEPVDTGAKFCLRLKELEA